ncbi:MAG: bifunctional phosphoribosylaminoimidazolecarboxamide formyltransferase/IMP cyclohydrolase PurH [Cryomorphaceae bacterium]|nr:MAG: bifunctional phosphoribosylaminoimidazolecarboxamide formyltransferase/IMP cyclohydrolase PurH [Cryomorphaceae bacterium]
MSTALISVFDKTGLEPLVQTLHQMKVEIISTGGTQTYIENLGVPVTPVEKLTGYPSILGGRVKTLHPKVFGGILNRRNDMGDQEQMKQYDLQSIDLVVVDLYPFEDTVAAGKSHEDIIEKIDIGGIALIRATAKNYADTTIVASKEKYQPLVDCLEANNGSVPDATRAEFATHAFRVSSGYDTAIASYLGKDSRESFSYQSADGHILRYGENPHQQGAFFGDLNAMFDQLHGKQLSYNNLLDVDAAVSLMLEFTDSEPTFAILKHNNACGLATRSTLSDAYSAALAADPVSAFGGILIANRPMDIATAELVNELFCEVVIAPAFEAGAQELLQSKKNRILLRQKLFDLPVKQFRSALNGVLVQDRDASMEGADAFQLKTKKASDSREQQDLAFANKIAKHTKSNTIVLAKNGQLLASGTGQTSRVDALRQAIHKAKSFGFDLQGAVMASDAFFPFPDCVEIAHDVGISAVVQPGGSIKDELSVAFCDTHNMAMVMTGVRHFKH